MKNSQFDLTVVVNLHVEAELAHPTLKAVARAVRHAEQSGLTCQLLLMINSPSKRMKWYVEKSMPTQLLDLKPEIIFVGFQDVGASRNAATALASGKNIVFVDGDNLFTDNWFTEGVRAINKVANRRLVIHPDLFLIFGDDLRAWKIRQSIDDDFSYRDIIEHNLWDSAAMMPIEIAIEVPYREMPSGGGFGPEDWQFNLDTLTAGIQHRTAEDTIYFYRVRRNSGLAAQHQGARSLLRTLHFNSLRELFPLRKKIVEKYSLQIMLDRFYAAARPKLRPVATLFPQFAHHLWLWWIRAYELMTPDNQSNPSDYKVISGKMKAAVLSAAEIEPGLLEILWSGRLPLWDPQPGHFANAFEDLFDKVSADCEYLVLVPNDALGGANLVSKNYAHAFSEASRLGSRRGVVKIIATDWLPESNAGTKIPGEPAALGLGTAFYALDEASRARVIAQAIVELGPTYVHVINSKIAFASITDFGKSIAETSRIVISVFCLDETFDGAGNHYTLVNSHQYMPYLYRVFADNQAVVDRLIDMRGYSPAICRVHRQPVRDDGLDWDGRGHLDNQKTGTIRVLWAGRDTMQKRFDVLREIARASLERNLDLEFVVYGVAADPSLPKNVDVVEGFSSKSFGGITAIRDNFDVYILTSQWEGMPNTLIEAFTRGLPAIVPNVGGVAELVVNGQNGIVVPNFLDVNSYVDALEELARDQQLRLRLASRARGSVAIHSRDNFVSTVAVDLELNHA
jgi:glycosyltransferase involved in cell wall biosynthesis